MLPLLNFKRVVFKVKATHRGVRWHGVKPLFASRTKELQRGIHVHFGVVKFRDRRGRHQVALIDQHRVVIGARDRAQLRDVFVQTHVHQAIFRQRVHLDGLAPARLQSCQRLRHGHLINQNLSLGQRHFRDAVAGLDQRRLPCFFGARNAGGALKEAPDIDRVGGVISALVDDLEHIALADDAGGDLHATGAPSVSERHLARAKGHLVTRHRHRLEQGTPNALLGALVKKGKVVVLFDHASSCGDGVAAPGVADKACAAAA